jgi:hypothetical protein
LLLDVVRFRITADQVGGSHYDVLNAFDPYVTLIFPGMGDGCEPRMDVWGSGYGHRLKPIPVKVARSLHA